MRAAFSSLQRTVSGGLEASCSMRFLVSPQIAGFASQMSSSVGRNEPPSDVGGNEPAASQDASAAALGDRQSINPFDFILGLYMGDTRWR